MQKKLERKLKSEAHKKGLKGKQADAYTYGNQSMKKMMTPSTHKAIVPPMTGMYD